MENNESAQPAGHSHCCEHGCCKRHGPVWRLVRVLVGVLVILLALSLGVAAGRHSEQRRLIGYGGGSAGFSGISQGFGMMQNGGYGGMMYGVPSSSGNAFFQRTVQKTVRVAGVITAIEGNKISFTDNGGGQQVLYTTADTVIIGAAGELPEASLKVKDFIVCFVTSGGGKNTAQVIHVQ